MNWWEGLIAGMTGAFGIQAMALMLVIRYVKRNPQQVGKIMMRGITGKKGKKNADNKRGSPASMRS